MLRRHERGDTLIEVLFAVSVFSFVIVGALAIMNQGMAAAQRSLEITLVRQQIDAQAETLRFMHDSYVAAYQTGAGISDQAPEPARQWQALRSYVANSGVQNDTFDNSSCPTSPLPGSFIVDPQKAAFTSNVTKLLPAGPTFAQLTYDNNGDFVSANGLWIRAVASADSTEAVQQNTGYVDFHIRACWESPGLPVPLSLGTIVRLYEPRG